MPHFDPHKVAAEIMEMLNALSLNGWSQKIGDAILQSHTPVELAMTLRHTLKELKTDQVLPAEILQKVNTLVHELDEILKHHHHTQP